MKQTAFTLIELIMVIAILGIIALIAVPTITTIINGSKEDAEEEQITLIENQARTYLVNDSLKLPNQTDDAFTCVSLNELQKAGLLSKEDITNPKTNETMTGGVKVTWVSKKYIYEYKEEGC